ncbi:response regulator [Paenibacillus sp. FSL R7-0652]|uniref:Response regulator n=1 Tax=Paenibacillus sp. AN1007 TaxID=3151385 RepID=A0AAU8N9Y1_9BACL
MRVILVDDENLALSRLNKLLLEREDCKVIGSFLKAEEAIEQIKHHLPDLVFMDIHMPGMNGIEATERIHEVSPKTEVIFTTAYNEHALTAYGLEVLDYIMKPVTRNRLDKTMKMYQRRAVPTPMNVTEEPEEPLMFIRCLGMLQVQLHPSEPPKHLKFRTTKIRELFAYLLHHRNKPIKRDTLLELLWPELEERKGISNLHSGIHRIRGMMNEFMGEDRMSVRYQHFGYILDTGEFRIDAEEWERRLNRLSVLSPSTLAEHRYVSDLYEGKYYGEDDYAWAELERQRLHALWQNHAMKLAQYYMDADQHNEAIVLYHRMHQFDPTMEEISLSLMKLYAELGNKDPVVAQYNQLAAALQQEAGIDPGFDVQFWYDEWKNKNS